MSDDKGLTLTAGDKNDSLLWSEEAGTSAEGELHVWSPYGSGKPSDRLPGFNGERVDPVSGTYHLGNGYRAYNPVLMRFNCQDSLSPFGAGGINHYAYCAGDPINHTDPSGHLSWQAITGIVAGIIGIGFAVFTAGASIAAAGGVMAAISSASASLLIIGGLGIASDITGIVSGAMEDSNPEASATLGWVSLATWLAGMAAGFAKANSVSKAGLRNTKEVNKLRSGSSGSASNFTVTQLDYPFFVREQIRFPEMEGVGLKPHYRIFDVDGALKFGSDTKVDRTSTDEILEFLLKNTNDDRNIVIVSGSHGEIRGNNWGKFKNSNEIVRNPALRDIHMLNEDKARYIKGLPEGLRPLNGRMEVIDIFDMNATSYSALLNDNSVHVIQAFCYSSLDEIYRQFFNLGMMDATASFFTIENLF
ncbi:RHS repeat-associated core domain-containing protein [Arsenophonus endosymbiont of Aphis craccivora]|uniref:RHS repeat-associated core domain-containing protein n=1 Tax=Arsenophonus endosymbiont of Aphis craccivora TaxID=1231049 RepID=UPI001EE16D66|nr:RHS repeat-associated core domain-containing protein [Arsenophonus endosymbiont of Aphis craccivora]